MSNHSDLPFDSTRAESYDIVCVSHLRWEFVYQRPQHLLSRFAKSRTVLFFEEPGEPSSEPYLETHQTDHVIRCVPHLPEGLESVDAELLQERLLAEAIANHGLDRFVLWYYTPMAVGFTRNLQPVARVYDCMDELSGFLGAPIHLTEREGELFDSADLVFTGGRSLYEAKRNRHPRVHLFPSSVDASHFMKARDPQPDPADQESIPLPRIGYYGVIDERLDLDLLREVAEAAPGWSFVMVGPVVKIDSSRLPTAPNLYYLGSKTYDELPRYAAGWDVAMMPFALNESTRFISPTKTPEYLASGLPVVTTPIHDVVAEYQPLGLVHIADGPRSFLDSIRHALGENREARLQRADELLSTRSWDSTQQQMHDLISSVIAVHDRRELGLGVLQQSNGYSSNGISTNGHTNGSNGHVVPSETPVDGKEPVIRIDSESPAHGFDYLVVGAGFAGSVIAERLATQEGKKVLIVDQRNHIGGNAYDHYNEEGILVHRYGPHIFHTNSSDVFHYLSQFTEWRPYQHRVMASVDGQLVPIPINLDTVNLLYGLSLTASELEGFFASVAEHVDQVKTSEDVVVSQVGRDLYDKFFRNYTRKQWGLDPSELDASVTARVPVRNNRDGRYFTDRYQAMPRDGYTRMFERILSHPNIKVMLNTSYREAAAFIPHKEVIYTGPIDEYFDYRFGRLPYRSLEFKFETLESENFQSAPVVNYPNEYDFTRVTEFKYLTGQKHSKTTVVYEFPRAEGDPYYPIPRPENAALFKRYKELAESTAGVHFVGRLGTYKYYNMDQVVAQALAVYRRISKTPKANGKKEDLHGAIYAPARALGGS